MKRASNHSERTPPSWELYFPGEKFLPTDRKADLICRLVDFFNSKDGKGFTSNVRLGSGAYSLMLDYQELRHACTCEHLYAALQVQPLEAVAALGAALYEVVFNTSSMAPKQFRPGKIRVRLINYTESMIPMRALKSNYIGRAVSVQGTVVRVCPVKAMVKRLEFVCGKCGGSSSLALTDGKYATPTRCATEHCRSKLFTPNRATAVTADWQKIRIQEQQGAQLNAQREEGRIPRTVECELMYEMVDACVPGDSVTVFGIVKAISTETDMGGGKGKGGKGQQQSLFFLYIDAVSLVNAKRREVPLANVGTPLPSVTHTGASSSNTGTDAATGAGMGAGMGAAMGAGNTSTAAGKGGPSNVAPSRDNAPASGPSPPALAIPGAAADAVAAGSTSCSSGSSTAGSSGWTFLAKDLEFVARFTTEYRGDQLRQLVQSLCPSIYGHDFVKAGLLLALMGGVQQGVGERDKVPTRGDIHVLVVGDPGLGKSQLLKGAANVAPRGIYVCGSSSTHAGLSVAVVKDAMTGDFVFEAGALVLADGGACCVDELDKMSAEHQALLEVMEQQSVSVAKAGLCTSLQARCSVLAAANPAGGHYNRAKTVNENLKMSAPLLSRFDLVFVIQDRPDELLDQKLSEHIMAMHAGAGARIEATRQALIGHASQPALASLPAPLSDTGGASGNGVASGSQYAGAGGPLATADARRHSLLERLKRHPGEQFEPLPAQLIRKYIAYARQYCHPKLSAESGDILAGFYKELRANTRSAEGIPVTTRQLESLIRLAQARARVELRELVTAADAQDVVELMKESLYDKFADEYGCVDFGRSSGMSKHKEAKRYLGALQKLSEAQAKNIFTVSELVSLADDIQLNVPDMNEFLSSLNTAGYLLKKGARCYQVQVSSGYSTQF
eukprot:jgi/Mesvir1/27055/Mv20750-RA.1